MFQTKVECLRTYQQLTNKRTTALDAPLLASVVDKVDGVSIGLSCHWCWLSPPHQRLLDVPLADGTRKKNIFTNRQYSQLEFQSKYCRKIPHVVIAANKKTKAASIVSVRVQNTKKLHAKIACFFLCGYVCFRFGSTNRACVYVGHVCVQVKIQSQQ